MQLVAGRAFLAILILSSVTTVFSANALAQVGGSRILPTEETVIGYLRGIELRAQPFSVNPGDWHESAGFTVPDERDIVIHTLVMYAATLPTPADAHDFFLTRARQLELDNEMTHAWNTPRAQSTGLDESREFRIVYVDVASRSRSAEYARLLRRGSIVGLVEVVGSPSADDEGLIDEDRRSILLGVAQQLMSRIVQQPLAPMNEARDHRFEWISGLLRI
ncbi:MAG: hypothetical protein ACKVVP_06315 [Chloroflexota bacterium]